jgi:kinesin family member 2/24
LEHLGDELEKAHEDIINTILEEEEVVIQAHRKQIDVIMDLMRAEMKLLHDVDQPGSAVDEYVCELDQVLEKKMGEIHVLRKLLAKFQKHLGEEEILSKSFRKDDGQHLF